MLAGSHQQTAALCSLRGHPYTKENKLYIQKWSKNEIKQPQHTLVTI
jgi:hypothetical protein